MAKEMKPMTSGNPVKLMLAFAVPMIIGALLQQLYNIVDTVVLGRYVGSASLAAISATGSSTMLILTLVTGVTGSITVIMAQYFGAQNSGKMRATITGSIYTTLAAAVIMIIAGFVLPRPVMRLLNTPDDIIDMSVLYMTICLTCGLAQLAYNVSASILRALGDSKAALYALILSSLLNVGLDLLFVIKFNMAVAGVAIATVISQALSAAFCVIYMFIRYPFLRIGKKDLKPDWQVISWMFRIGIPMGLRGVCLGIGMMTITRVINGFGTNTVAAHGVGSRIEQLAALAFNNLASSFSTYAGQNLGAQKYDRIRDGFRKMLLVTIIACLVSTVIVQLFAPQIVGVFVKSNETEVINMAVSFLRIESTCYVALGLIWLYQAALRGFGEVFFPITSSFVELGAKILVSIFLSIPLGSTGIWWAAPIGWVLGIIPIAIRYHSGKWQIAAEKRHAAEEAAAVQAV